MVVKTDIYIVFIVLKLILLCPSDTLSKNNLHIGFQKRTKSSIYSHFTVDMPWKEGQTQRNPCVLYP